MTNLFRFILMALAWALLWAVSYYGCIKPEYCPEDQAAVTAPAAAPVSDDYELVSRTGSAEVLDGDLWAAERKRLLDKFNADPTQTMEVYGHYYKGEVPAPGDRELGQRRANAIKEIMVKAGIPAASITALPRELSGDAPPKGELWDAGAFSWVQAAAEGQTDKVTELDSDQIKINFPYNEAQTRLSDNTENYLEKLAKVMTETEATVAITGHTDERGRPEYNMGLGKRRAEFVKRRLVSYGVQANRISTTSMGETKPEIPMAKTDKDHYENRRAILRVNYPK